MCFKEVVNFQFVVDLGQLPQDLALEVKVNLSHPPLDIPNDRHKKQHHEKHHAPPRDEGSLNIRQVGQLTSLKNCFTSNLKV